MPYADIDDSTLPRSVQQLPKRLRNLWLSVFKAQDSDDEGTAHKSAWSAVRKEAKHKKPDAPSKDTHMMNALKSIALNDWEDSVSSAFHEATGGRWWALAVYDDHVIARPDGPTEIGEERTKRTYRVNYTGTTKTAADGQTEFVTDVEFAPRDTWIPVIPTFAAIMLVEEKEADEGRRRWLGVSSGGFEDREGEIVSTAFLDDALDRAEKSGERGDLRIWHIPGSKVGGCDYQVMHEGFLLESGLMDDSAAGRNATAWMQENKDARLSIQFMYKNRSTAGVYSPPGAIVERSILPPDVAAFPWAGITLKEYEMSQQINDEKRQKLQEIIGEDEATEVLDNLESGSTQLKAANVRFKEIDAEESTEDAEIADVDAPAAETEDEAQTEVKEVDAEVVDEPVVETIETFDFELNEKAIADIAGAVVAQISPLIEPLVAEIERLRAATKEMGADLAGMVTIEEQRIAEKAAQLPRATVRRIVRPTKTKEASADANSDNPTNMLEQGVNTLYS